MQHQSFFAKEQKLTETGFLVDEEAPPRGALRFRIAAAVAIASVAGIILLTLWGRTPDPAEPAIVAAETGAAVAVAASERDSIKHLICTIRSVNDAPTRTAALQRMNQLTAKISADALRRIEAEAIQSCFRAIGASSVEAYRVSWRQAQLNPRSSAIVAAFMFPGDLVVTGLYEIAIQTGVYVMAKLIDDVVRSIGDIFVGALSICFWCLALRFAFVLTVVMISADAVRRYQEHSPPVEASARLSPKHDVAEPEPAAEPTFSRDYLTKSDNTFRT